MVPAGAQLYRRGTGNTGACRGTSSALRCTTSAELHEVVPDSTVRTIISQAQQAAGQLALA
jgi:hypothetical protein